MDKGDKKRYEVKVAEEYLMKVVRRVEYTEDKVNRLREYGCSDKHIKYIVNKSSIEDIRKVKYKMIDEGKKLNVSSNTVDEYIDKATFSPSTYFDMIADKLKSKKDIDEIIRALMYINHLSRGDVMDNISGEGEVDGDSNLLDCYIRSNFKRNIVVRIEKRESIKFLGRESCSVPENSLWKEIEKNAEKGETRRCNGNRIEKYSKAIRTKIHGFEYLGKVSSINNELRTIEENLMNDIGKLIYRWYIIKKQHEYYKHFRTKDTALNRNTSSFMDEIRAARGKALAVCLLERKTIVEKGYIVDGDYILQIKEKDKVMTLIDSKGNKIKFTLDRELECENRDFDIAQYKALTTAVRALCKKRRYRGLIEECGEKSSELKVERVEGLRIEIHKGDRNGYRNKKIEECVVLDKDEIMVVFE